MIIFTMFDGSLPWSLHDWFMEQFWCVWMGYSTLLEKSYTYELYIGLDVEGEHSFTFAYGK